MFLAVSKKRLLSGLIVGAFGFLIVSLGDWWFSISISLIVHLALLEFFQMAEFTGIRPATKTTLMACQILLFFTQLSSQGYISIEISDAILPLSGAAICGWLLLQPVTGSIADVAASIFGLFYLGFLPSHWIKLRNLLETDLTTNFNLIPTDWSSSITFGMLITFSTCFMIVGFDIGSVIIAATQEKILLKGGGHKMAGGFSINISNIEKFKDFIFRKFKNINEDLTKQKPLLIDSKIAPSAINLEFYDKVDILSPFGSGNPEPKFIVENLKSVNNRIVGEKHIKSVLIGPEGTNIKTIAFN